MKKPRPLTDLEMFELLQIAYPEKFTDESDDSWDEAMDFDWRGASRSRKDQYFRWRGAHDGGC